MVRATVFTLPDDLTPPLAADRGTGPEPGSRFLLGPENIVVRQAAETMGQDPPPYCPIVLHGPSGSGKSHLLQLLTRRRNAAAADTLSTTAADFSRTFGRATHHDTVPQFRSRVRRLSLLVIDDVHELADKGATQQELVRAIDAIVRRGGMVLAALRQPVLETDGLLPTLASRLAGGLSLPLLPPALETRRALLNHFAARHDLELSPEIVDLLATETAKPSPLPVMPGRLAALVGMLARLSADVDRDVDAALVKQTLELQLTATRPKPSQILTTTARYCRLPAAELRSASRRSDLVRARSLAMYLIRSLTDSSLQETGKLFGGRDHTTVLHAVRKIDKLRGDDADTQRTLADLVQALSPDEEG